jgi:DNA-binding FadR family transcriptional regulator
MRSGRALDRAEKEHQQLLKLCQQGQTKLASEHLVGHIEKVRKDLHALFKKRASAVSAPAKP